MAAMLLDEGRIIGGQLLCPHHRACFDVRTGAALSGPAVRPLCAIAVKLEHGHVFCNLGEMPRSRTC
jgi:nitrite reductase/ring-hydroxylating ferredoxin subunit